MNAGMQSISCIIPCLHLIHLYVMEEREPDPLIHSVLCLNIEYATGYFVGSFEL